MIFIYGLRCPIEGVIRYIGKSVEPEKRIRAHFFAALRGDYNHRTARWLRKIAKAGKFPELVILHSVVEGERWQDVERAFIASAEARGWKLTNTTAGGEGLDYIDPEADAAYRKKLSASHKRLCDENPERLQQIREMSANAWADPEVTARRLVSMKSAQNRPEVRARNAELLAKMASDPELQARKAAKNSAAWTGDAGIVHRAAMKTEDARQRMSEAAKRKWHDPAKRQKLMTCFSSAEHRQRRSEAAKQRSTPEYRAMMAEKTRLSWAKRRAKGV